MATGSSVYGRNQATEVTQNESKQLVECKQNRLLVGRAGALWAEAIDSSVVSTGHVASTDNGGFDRSTANRWEKRREVWADRT